MSDATAGARFRGALRPWALFGAAAALCALAAITTFTLCRLTPIDIAAVKATSAKSAPNASDKAVDLPLAFGVQGYVDNPPHESVVGNTLSASGWALAKGGIRDVQVQIDGQSFAAQYGSARLDVAAVKPEYPNAAASGFTFDHDVSNLLPTRHVAKFVATDNAGNTSVFAKRSVIPFAALAMWRPMLDLNPRLVRDKFYFLMMLSGVALGASAELDSEYRDYVSATQVVGMSVPILYMRTTRGIDEDWRFDAAFNISHMCHDRRVAEDNLATVIAYSIERHIPVQFILNGGIWSNSSCETSHWDLNDYLEQDEANCQWTQSDKVYPKDYLKGLLGSLDSPRLARSLTYNVYATSVRRYKRRNLQSAARIIAGFARDHPDLFVGVALDSDTYMNPFFRFKEIFDYNPGMLRQFREWLRGTGPYGGKPSDGAPDLSRYRRAKTLRLSAVNAMARQHWQSWDEVDPPRHFPGFPRDPFQLGETPIWLDPWWQVWDEFRKHIVGLHYDELSQWVHESGIPSDKIFSAQGFIQPDPGSNPSAIRINSHNQNQDSAGVSIEGSIPRFGHLGAVIYGEASRNNVQLEDGHSIFAEFGRMDDGWAIVEYNSTDLKRPNELPTYAMAYKTFRDAFNYGAREVSAMAWNGGNGINAGKPGYVPYTTWRNTAPEEAMRDHLVSHANVPRGARLWTFGTPQHIDDDGWSAARGEVIAAAGSLNIRPESSVVTLLSPPDQVIYPQQIGRLLLRWEGPVRPRLVSIAAQIQSDAEWINIPKLERDGTLMWPSQWIHEHLVVQRIKLELTFPKETESAILSRVLLYPSSPAPRTP